MSYQLSHWQYNHLVWMANGPDPTWDVGEPMMHDLPRCRNAVAGDLNEMLDLIRIGLVMDITRLRTKELAAMAPRYGRTYRRMALTPDAFEMFRNADERPIQ